MIFLDALFRFSGIGLLVLLALICWRDYRSWPSAPYLILACISVSALFIGYTPNELLPPEPILTIARFTDIPHLVFVWLFALSLFKVEFRLQRFHVVVAVLYCTPIVWLRLNSIGLAPALPQWIFIYGSLTSLLLMGHLCYATLRGRSDDLLAPRRAARIYFVMLIIFVAVTAAVIDPLPADSMPIDKRTAKIISIWLAIAWGTIWLLSFDRRAASFGAPSGSGRELGLRDEALKNNLAKLMKEEQVFRETDLTIIKLATRLSVSQHALRSLINQGLGYANFSAYINTFRIDAVKRTLAESKAAHLPILSIAMDCGFKSLSTFNKAFKTIEGVTPTEYRKSMKS